jgi:hypothetical protein
VGDISGVFIIYSSLISLVVRKGGFSNVFDIAAAAIVQELVIKDSVKTNDMTSASRSLFIIMSIADFLRLVNYVVVVVITDC